MRVLHVKIPYTAFETFKVTENELHEWPPAKSLEEVKEMIEADPKEYMTGDPDEDPKIGQLELNIVE